MRWTARHVDHDDAALPTSGKVIVSYARWYAEREALLASGLSVGIRIPNTVDIATVLPEIAERPLIALDFPAFPDGRAYSQARLLAERIERDGVLLHGGYDARGRYLPPRSTFRVPAITAWTGAPSAWITAHRSATNNAGL